MKRRFWRALLGAALWLLWLVPLPIHAGPRFDASGQQLIVVTADESAATENIVSKLRGRFPNARLVQAFNVRPEQANHPVYVAVGPGALRTLLSQHLDAPIVSVFVSNQVYQEILLEAGAPELRAVTAIYPEPSPVEHLRLIAAIYRKPISVAVLTSPKTAYLVPALRQSAPRLDIDLKVELVDTQDHINAVLNRVANTAVVLALPDPTIYTPENIRNILITTYRRNQAVVGFSAAFVKAGALASNVSSIPQILTQLDELLDEFALTGRVLAPQFPRYFEVVVNDGVARSLNLVVDEAARQPTRSPAGAPQ